MQKAVAALKLKNSRLSFDEQITPIFQKGTRVNHKFLNQICQYMCMRLLDLGNRGYSRVVNQV